MTQNSPLENKAEVYRRAKFTMTWRNFGKFFLKKYNTDIFVYEFLPIKDEQEK